MSAAVAELEKMGLVAKIGEVGFGRKAAVRLRTRLQGMSSPSTRVRRMRLRAYRRWTGGSCTAGSIGCRRASFCSARRSAARSPTKSPPRWPTIPTPAGDLLRDDRHCRAARAVGPDSSSDSGKRRSFSCSNRRRVPVVLENNVNCAAVAERSNGVAKDLETFAYVQTGLKIGMGLMLDGQACARSQRCCWRSAIWRF